MFGSFFAQKNFHTIFLSRKNPNPKPYCCSSDTYSPCLSTFMHTDIAKSFRILVLDLSLVVVVAASSSVPSSSAKTASMIGIIMAVVAVFEIHIDKKAVGSMKLRISIREDVPTILMALSAILLCRSTCSTAAAIMRPAKGQECFLRRKKKDLEDSAKTLKSDWFGLKDCPCCLVPFYLWLLLLWKSKVNLCSNSIRWIQINLWIHTIPSIENQHQQTFPTFFLFKITFTFILCSFSAFLSICY